MARDKKKSHAYRLPLMALRDQVVFPRMIVPFVVGREFNIEALQVALASNHYIFLATQRDAAVEEPKPKQIYEVGTIASIAEHGKLPDGSFKVLAESVERAFALSIRKTKGYFEATVSTMQREPKMSPAIQATVQRVQNLLEKYRKLCQSRGKEADLPAKVSDDPSRLSDSIAAILPLLVEEKQNLLEVFDSVKRLDLVAELLADEIADTDKETETPRSAPD